MACVTEGQVTEGQAVPDGWSIMCEAGTQGRETGGLTPGRAHFLESHHCSGQEPPDGDPSSGPPSLCLCFCRGGKDLDQLMLQLQWVLSPAQLNLGHHFIKVEDTCYSCPCCFLLGQVS